MKINLSKLIYTSFLLQACATNIKNLQMINEEKEEKSQEVKHINDHRYGHMYYYNTPG